MGQFSALTHIWWSRSTHPDDARFEQIDFPTPIHLSFDELEFADLTLGLAV
jgi:hypothetical protein